MSLDLRYAVFVEPVGELREFLREQKARIESQLPGQTYCSHPPHSTLIHGAFDNIREWQAELCAGVSDLQPFDLVCSDMQVFYDDALAGGGHTVAVRADRSAALAELQLIAAGVLAGHAALESATSEIEWQDPMKTSVERYGFPFVGEHWIPHFTIASLQVGRDDPLLKDLMANDVSFRMTIDTASAWSIRGDVHEKLFDAPLSE